VLDEDLVDLREQRIHELVLGVDADDLALAEDRTLPHTAGDANVGVLRLTGSVDLATHDRDLHRGRQRAEALLCDLRERDEVDVRAAARRAGDEGEALIAKPEGLQHVESGGHFHDRVLRERHADGVTDALIEKDAHAGGRTDRAGNERARLRDAEVQRIGHGLREATVRRDHRRDVERLDADDDVVEVEVLEDPDLAEREVDHALRLVAYVARLTVADRAVVHADADRGSLDLRPLHHLAHAVLVVDVPRIETELVHLRVKGHERELVVEVDVRDDRENAAADDLFEGLAGTLVRHRNAGDLAADLLKSLDLADRRVDVVREGGAH